MRDLDKEKIEYYWGDLPACSRVRLSMLAMFIALLQGFRMRRVIALATIVIGVIFTIGHMIHVYESGLVAGIGIGLILAGILFAWLFQGYFDK